MQINKVSGNAIPRQIGSPQADLRALYRYLFEVMEQLRFALEELDRRTKDGGSGKTAARKKE